VPSPAVRADVYDADYYLHRCAGSTLWRDSGGSDRDPMYDGYIQLAGLTPGQRVLDIGTGRGELLVAALGAGAASVTGVDYSESAVILARKTLQRCDLDTRAEVLVADARALPVPDQGFDLVTMFDVVEHLTATELSAAFAEARRALRPGGRIFIHTFPTSTLYDVTYRLQRLSRLGRRATWPRDPRNEFEHTMHVGEQSLGSLRRALRAAAFAEVRVWPGEWIHTDFVPEEPARRLYHRLARVPLLRRFGIADLWAEARRST
jgi:ubiquinone/menaquinone biosynthesis C-methylase UbiE